MTSTNTHRSAWGVDGCKAGWFFFRLGPPSGVPFYGLVERLEQVVEMAGSEDSILVDIPIGLPDRASQDRRDRETAFRACDEAARGRLGGRKSSVFPVPVRSVMEALRDEMGLRIHPKDDEEKKQRRWGKVRGILDGRKLSVAAGEGRITAQSFAILPKIVEADDLLRGNAKARKIVRETHPEVCFRALVSDDRKERLETFSKKHGLGFLNRIAILKACYPGAKEAILEACEGKPEVASDDIVDAMACAVIATVLEDEMLQFPEAKDYEVLNDENRRLRREIVYASPDAVRRACAEVTAALAR